MRDPNHLPEIGRLKRRADFLRAAKGRRVHTRAFTLQASVLDEAQENPRVGFTLTRKVGGAVVRNRARRRLKEAVRSSNDLSIEAGRDYVFVGRIDAIRVPFEQLKQDLARAFGDVRRESIGPRAKKPRPQRTRPTA